MRIRRRQTGSLSAQLLRQVAILGFIAIVGVLSAVILGITATLVQSQQDLQHTSANAARTFDLFWQDMYSDLVAVGDSVTLVEDTDELFRAALDRHPPIFDIKLVNSQGNILAQRQRVGTSAVRQLAQQPWLNSVLRGELYLGPVDSSEYGVPFIDMAMPIYGHANDFAGILVVKLDLSALWSEVSAIRQGEEGYGYLITEDGQLLAYSDLALVRDGKRISQKPSEIEDGTFYGLFSLYKGLEDRWILASSTRLEFVPWYAVVEQPMMEPLSGVTGAFVVFVLALLLSLIMIFSIVRFIRRGVVRPLVQLREGARVFAAWNLEHQIEAKGSLELRDLASTLNDMAADLKQSHAEVEESNRTLEQRVREQTRNLALVTEVTNRAASILDMQELLQMVADLTKQTFNLYHAHVYVLDRKTESLVLAAGAGETGRRMVAQGHQIPYQMERSVVARAARERGVVTVDDVRLSPDFLPNPLLPQTVSELAVALAVGDQVMGVLDVQSDEVAGFDAALSSLMSTLAGQIAVALRNAQLYTEAERTSRHERALSVITEQIQSASSLDELLQIAVRELGKALRVPQATVALQLPAESEEPEFTHS